MTQKDIENARLRSQDVAKELRQRLAEIRALSEAICSKTK